MTSAIRNTLAQGTVDLTIGGSLVVAGHVVPISGSGQADLAADDLQMDVSGTARGNPFVVKELAVHGAIYMEFDVGGTDVMAVDGRHWMQLPFSIPAGTGDADPLDALRTLAAKGSTVTALGPSTVDGIAVQGYSVVPSRQAMVDNVDQLLANSTMTPAEKAQVRSAAEHDPPGTSKLWFSADQLMRRMDVSMQLSPSTASVTEQMTMTIDLSHYGAPVTIVPPAPGDVTSARQFQQIASAAGSGAG